MVVRDRPGWFNKASEPVLELLNESPYALTAPTLLFNAQREFSDPPGKGTLYDTLPTLVEHGFLEKHKMEGRGTELYEITDRGRAYLSGDLEIENIA